YPGTPSHVSNPDIGDVTATDCAGRPLYPSLFLTDITNNPNDRSGDWSQQNDNSTAMAPSDINGTWKAAIKSGSTISPGTDPAKNGKNFGPGAATPPTIYKDLGYGTEVVWTASSLGLQSGHVYRAVFMVHDGDQNHTGGDVGEACF